MEKEKKTKENKKCDCNCAKTLKWERILCITAIMYSCIMGILSYYSLKLLKEENQQPVYGTVILNDDAQNQQNVSVESQNDETVEAN